MKKSVVFMVLFFLSNGSSSETEVEKYLANTKIIETMARKTLVGFFGCHKQYKPNKSSHDKLFRCMQQWMLPETTSRQILLRYLFIYEANIVPSNIRPCSKSFESKIRSSEIEKWDQILCFDYKYNIGPQRIGYVFYKIINRIPRIGKIKI